MSNTTQLPADVRERVLTMLTAMEWSALVEHHDGRWYACCPWCGGENPDDDETPPGRAGHAERCELAAVLALLRTPRGEGKAVRLLGLAMERAELLCQDAGRAEWPLSDFGRDMLQARLDTVRDLIGDALAALRSEASGQGGIHPDPETWRCRQCGGYAAHYRDCPALRSEAPAPGWSEVRERANMLRAVLREHGFEHLRSALVGQHSDAMFYGQWERHKTLLRDLLDALDAALRSEAQGEADDFNPLTDLLPEHEAERVERVLSRAARRGEGGA